MGVRLQLSTEQVYTTVLSPVRMALADPEQTAKLFLMSLM
jgi:hypothetical protein